MNKLIYNRLTRYRLIDEDKFNSFFERRPDKMKLAFKELFENEWLSMCIKTQKSAEKHGTTSATLFKYATILSALGAIEKIKLYRYNEHADGVKMKRELRRLRGEIHRFLMNKNLEELQSLKEIIIT